MSASLKPTLFLVSGRTIGFAATFFIPVILARVFSQAEFGTYKQILLIYATVYHIAQFGMAESLYYFVPRAPREAGRYVANAVLFLIVGGIGGLAVIMTARADIARILGNDLLTDHLALLGLFTLLMMPSAVVEFTMVARSRYRMAAVTYGVSDTARSAFLILPVLTLGWGIDGLLLGALAFATLRLGAAVAYVARTFGADFRPATPALASQLRYAVPFGSAAVLEIVQSTFHQYAVAYRFDAATFAIYSVGCLQIPLVDFVAISAATVLMVQMNHAVRDGAGERALLAWHRTIRELALMLVPLVGLLLIIARDLVVLLFTTTYLPSVPIFMIWSVGILFSVLPTDAVLRGYAETRFILGLNALRLVLVVVTLPLFLSIMGLSAAVLLTLVTAAVAKGVALLKMRSLLGTAFSQLVPWRDLGVIGVATIVAATPAALLGAAFETATLPRLIVTTLIYVGTYLMLLFKLHLLTEGERCALAQRRTQWTASTVMLVRDLRRVVRPASGSGATGL